MIRLADVKLPRASLDNVAEALAKGELSFRMHWVPDFERAFADWLGVKHAVACSSGHAAVHLALLGLPPPYIAPAKRVRAQVKTEVVVPNLTYHATANAVMHVGLTPVFADVDPETWNLDPQCIELAISRRTRVVIAVDLLGQPCDPALKKICAKSKVPLVEDACEGTGGSCGHLGDVAAFSFFANKPLTTGEGGMVVTDDEDIAERARLYRDQGDHSDCYRADVVGFNYRPTAIQGALGLGQIPVLSERCAARVELRERYIEHFPALANRQRGNEAAFMFGLKVPRRSAVRASLALEGIETRNMFPLLSTLAPFRHLSSPPCPVAKSVAENGILLPCHEGMSLGDVDTVCDAIKRAMQ